MCPRTGRQPPPTRGLGGRAGRSGAPADAPTGKWRWLCGGLPGDGGPTALRMTRLPQVPFQRSLQSRGWLATEGPLRHRARGRRVAGSRRIGWLPGRESLKFHSYLGLSVPRAWRVSVRPLVLYPFHIALAKAPFAGPVVSPAARVSVPQGWVQPASPTRWTQTPVYRPPLNH
jgi:hypothetical protein